MNNWTKDIWNLQHELNIMIGRDTINDPERTNWFFDYVQALEDEIIELKNCINWKWWTKESKDSGQYNLLMDPKNAKIEAIDALHFYISLFHIMDISDFTFFKKPVTNVHGAPTSVLLFTQCEELINVCRSLKDLTNWANVEAGFLNGRLGFRYNREVIVRQCLMGWDSLNNIFQLLDMNLEEIHSIYKKKHQKNIERQKNNYSVMTKTDADNNEIKQSL